MALRDRKGFWAFEKRAPGLYLYFQNFTVILRGSQVTLQTNLVETARESDGSRWSPLQFFFKIVEEDEKRGIQNSLKKPAPEMKLKARTVKNPLW